MDTTVRELHLSTYRVPTPAPEADGTATWAATELLVVEPVASRVQGLAWSCCAAPAALDVVRALLADVVLGSDALNVPGTYAAMNRAVRNAGRPGLVSMAISAVDLALWDLKAKLLDLPLDRLLGRCRDSVPVYGSGGFVSLTDDQLRTQLTRWTAEQGIGSVKIKVGQDWGRDPGRDLARTALTRQLVGDDVHLMVDANGGYTPGQARRIGSRYDDLGVVWLEEPVSSDDLSGLALLRRELRCDIAAGEYADGPQYAQRMCAAGSVDCLQIDVTRCGGITGWLSSAAIADSQHLQVSGHCVPSLHLAPALAAPNLRHVELFADHERLEPMLFDGVPEVVGGALHPVDLPGNGMSLAQRAQRWQTGAVTITGAPG